MKYTCFFILNLFFSNFIFSQVYLFTSEENGKVVENRILMDNEYFIQSSKIIKNTFKCNIYHTIFKVIKLTFT